MSETAKSSKETKKIVSLAFKPSVKDKLKDLSNMNNYSMSSYIEAVLLKAWKDYEDKGQDAIMISEDPYIKSLKEKESEKPVPEKVGGRIRSDKFN